MKSQSTRSLLAVAAFGVVTFSGAAVAAPDAAAAQELAKSSGCMTCHAIDKQKMAPSFKDVAKKYKGKADAQDAIVKHITLKPMVEVDGQKMPHKAVKSSDPAQAANVAQWILSL